MTLWHDSNLWFFFLIGVSMSDYELLCTDGTRADLSAYHTCNWGQVPTPAIVTTSAKTLDQRNGYQDFLEASVTEALCFS